MSHAGEIGAKGHAAEFIKGCVKRSSYRRGNLRFQNSDNALAVGLSERNEATGRGNPVRDHGVQEGMQLSVGGRGNAGERGGPPGDLIILIEEEPHPELHRDGLGTERVYDSRHTFMCYAVANRDQLRFRALQHIHAQCDTDRSGDECERAIDSRQRDLG